MPSPILDALTKQVAKNKDVEASALILINGFADRLVKAIADALANGATADELAPLQAEVDALKTSADALVDAVIQNTPSATVNQNTPTAPTP